jgi:hypothetical protein
MHSSSNRETAQTPLNDDGELAPIFFRAEIPKWVLSFVVGTTLLLGGYSLAYVQPSILGHYRAICDRNLQSLGILDLVHSQKIDLQALRSDALPDSVPLDQRIHLLEETQLCLRRLINAQSADDALRIESAQVAEFLALCFHQKAAEPVSEDDPKAALPVAADALLARAQSEHQRALDAMQSAIKLNGSHKLRALLLFANASLNDSPALSGEALAELERSAREAMPLPDLADAAKSILGRTLAQRALRPSLPATAESRLSLLREANELTSPDTPTNIQLQAAKAEILLGLDAAASQKVAWQASQSIWNTSKSASPSVASLCATFECLILGGSLRESQAFLSEQFGKISQFDQLELRKRSSHACLRLLVASLLNAKERSNPEQLELLLLNSALQLDPESPDLLSLLDAVTEPQAGDPVFASLSKKLEMGSDPRWKQFVSAFKSLRSGADAAGIKEFTSSLKTAPAMCVATSRLAMRIVQKQSTLANSFVTLLTDVNQAAPEVLAVWSDRAALHLMLDQFSQAVTCLEFLIKKLPDNVELKNALESAKQRAQPQG